MKYTGVGYTGASGKQGGVVFSHNRYGSYQRAKGSVTNPQTTLQTDQRNLLGSIAANYKTLPEVNRQEFTNFALSYSLPNGQGGFYIPTGYQLYLMENLNSRLVGAGLQNFPVAVGVDENITALSALIDVSAATFTIASTSTGGALGLKIEVTPPVPKGLSYGSIKNRFRSLRDATTGQYGPAVLGTNTSTDIADNWIYTTGSVITGNVWSTLMQVWIRVTPLKSDFTNGPAITMVVTLQP